MTVKALYEYDYPAADRAELFGDDQIVRTSTGSATCCSVPRRSGNLQRAAVGNLRHRRGTSLGGNRSRLRPRDDHCGRRRGGVRPGRRHLTDRCRVGHKSLLKFTTAS